MKNGRKPWELAATANAGHLLQKIKEVKTMAYKNSGAMKFNDATDLVIRADPDYDWFFSRHIYEIAYTGM